MMGPNWPVFTIRTVRIVNSDRTLICNKISMLWVISLFDRIVNSNSCIVATNRSFLRVTGCNSLFSLYPTPYRGSGFSPALTLGDTHLCQRHHQSTQSKSRVATHPAKNAVATLTTPQAKEKRYG